MTDTTPQIEAILEQLTEICCGSVDSTVNMDDDRVEQLVLSLSTNGWERHQEKSPPLSVILKQRIKDHCREPAMHRGGELDGIVAKVQKAYERVSRYRHSTPKNQNGPSAQSPHSTG